ncbi:MAG: MarR family transcriptional regulator [Thermomicrobiales bacterium]|nr:MarR family transcriptional regulator [Thermomicrobiales bacterium]
MMEPDARAASNELNDAVVLEKQLSEALERLAFPPFLGTWNRLTWWISVWPVFRHLETMELGFPETFVLQMLMMRPLNVSEVAEMLGLCHSSASRAVDRLVAGEFVSREEDPVDRRQKRLTLTATGRQKVEEVDTVFGEEFTSLASALSHDERATLQHILSKVAAASVNSPGAPPERVTWGRAFVEESDSKGT